MKYFRLDSDVWCCECYSRSQGVEIIVFRGEVRNSRRAGILTDMGGHCPATKIQARSHVAAVRRARWRPSATLIM
jgi:hypothetical protein